MYDEENAMSDMIEVKNLKKKFENLEVLNGITTSIKQGEVVVVIGPSGSGKSTFLRCLNRLEEITEGEVFLDGQKINDPATDINKIRQKMGKYSSISIFFHI